MIAIIDYVQLASKIDIFVYKVGWLENG